MEHELHDDDVPMANFALLVAESVIFKASGKRDKAAQAFRAKVSEGDLANLQENGAIKVIGQLSGASI